MITRGCWRLHAGAAVAAGVLAMSGGCGPEPIDVDMSSSPVRFFIDHRGWPRPFWWPRVTEFAIADDRDELVWHLQADDETGRLAHKLAFIYGREPPGFHQVFPLEGAPPPPLVRGRTYFIAAGGPRAVYRMAFSLPVDSREHRQLRE